MKFTHRILNDRTSYGWGPILMHWLIALAIIGLYPLGLYITGLTYYDPDYRIMPHWHKSIGLLVLGLLALRLGWRLINRPPAPLPQPKLLTIATHLVHNLLYLLLIVVLISGYLISTADGRAIDLFNWFAVPALPALMENQEDVAGVVHYYSATALIVLSALHALAALKHHFINKDDTLKRMFGLRKA